MGVLYTPRAKANRELLVEAVPNTVIANATTAQEVKKGSVCRIKGTAGGFVTFGTSTVGIPSVSTKDTIETEIGFFKIVATDDFIRTSAIMRVEIIKD